MCSGGGPWHGASWQDKQTLCTSTGGRRRLLPGVAQAAAPTGRGSKLQAPLHQLISPRRPLPPSACPLPACFAGVRAPADGAGADLPGARDGAQPGEAQAAGAQRWVGGRKSKLQWRRSLAWQPSPVHAGTPNWQSILTHCLTPPDSLPLPVPAHCAGTSQWPGANFILFPTGDKVFLKFGDRRRIASELKIGDVVERHLDSECSVREAVCFLGGFLRFEVFMVLSRDF